MSSSKHLRWSPPLSMSHQRPATPNTKYIDSYILRELVDCPSTLTANRYRSVKLFSSPLSSFPSSTRNRAQPDLLPSLSLPIFAALSLLLALLAHHVSNLFLTLLPSPPSLSSLLLFVPQASLCWDLVPSIPTISLASVQLPLLSNLILPDRQPQSSNGTVQIIVKRVRYQASRRDKEGSSLQDAFPGESRPISPCLVVVSFRFVSLPLSFASNSPSLPFSIFSFSPFASFALSECAQPSTSTPYPAPYT